MRSHIILPGELFEDEVSREVHTLVREDLTERGIITERHLTPVSEVHLLEGLYCECSPEVIEMGDPREKKYGVLHRSDLLFVAVPSSLPEVLE